MKNLLLHKILTVGKRQKEEDREEERRSLYDTGPVTLCMVQKARPDDLNDDCPQHSYYSNPAILCTAEEQWG